MGNRVRATVGRFIAFPGHPITDPDLEPESTFIVQKGFYL